MTENNKMRAEKFMKENNLFIECCTLADVPPTKRQVSKFRMGRGRAFKMKGEVIRKRLIKEGIIAKLEERKEDNTHPYSDMV